tara:strand:- start:128 stop:337 length:210 start_codon:yes stop_codon:yes gene_type:complete
MDIPNGGFPPFERCKPSKSKKSKKGKFFEFSSETKDVNIRQILEKKNKKEIIVSDITEDALEEISEINK